MTNKYPTHHKEKDMIYKASYPNRAVVLSALHAHKHARPLVVGCFGFGGLGKTTWVRSMVEAFPGSRGVCSEASKYTTQQAILDAHIEQMRSAIALGGFDGSPVVFTDRTSLDIFAYSMAKGEAVPSVSSGAYVRYDVLFDFRGNRTPDKQGKRAAFAHLETAFDDSLARLVEIAPAFHGPVYKGRTKIAPGFHGPVYAGRTVSGDPALQAMRDAASVVCTFAGATGDLREAMVDMAYGFGGGPDGSGRCHKGWGDM